MVKSKIPLSTEYYKNKIYFAASTQQELYHNFLEFCGKKRIRKHKYAIFRYSTKAIAEELFTNYQEYGEFRMKNNETFFEKNPTIIKEYDEETNTVVFVDEIQDVLVQFMQKYSELPSAGEDIEQKQKNSTSSKKRINAIIYENITIHNAFIPKAPTHSEEIFYKEATDLANNNTVFLEPLTNSLSLHDILLQYFYHKNSVFLYNEYEFVPIHAISNSGVSSTKVEVVSQVEEIKFPTKYRATCMQKTRKNHNCGNIVYYSEVHKQSTLRCTDSGLPSTHDESHTIKSLNEGITEENITLYIYEVKNAMPIEVGTEKSKDALEKTSKYIISPFQLEFSTLTLNVTSVSLGKEPMLFVVSQKVEDNEELFLEESILVKSEENKKHHSFVEDIYDSLKLYLQKYHDITLTDDNRVVGEYLILTTIANIYFHHLSKVLIAGTSGSGKSFWSRILLPLFTSNTSIVSGVDVTRNRLLGGRSNYISKTLSSTFSGGFISNNDVVVLEEMTNALNAFFEASRFSSSSLQHNTFSMIKGVDYKFQEFDVGIQGSPLQKVRSNVVMLGNLEQLKAMRETYIKLVRRHYKVFNVNGEDPQFSMSWPLYKSIRFYREELKNPSLAKSHEEARREMFTTQNFITFLPEAEQSRISVFIVLEDYEQGFTPRISNASMSLSGHVHRRELDNDLTNLFSEQLPVGLFHTVQRYLEYEYFPKQPNNIIIDNSTNMYIHLRENIARLMAILIFANRLYWEQKSPGKEELTAQEKQLINRYLLYNYNTLSRDEAAKRKLPKPMSFVYNRDDTANESEELKFIIEKKKEEEKHDKTLSINMSELSEEDKKLFESDDE
jgi:hypothetical protein